MFLVLGYFTLQASNIYDLNKHIYGNTLSEFEYIKYLSDVNVFYGNSENLSKFSWSESSAAFLGTYSVFYLLLYALSVLSKPKLITGKEHGTARWGNPSELNHLKAKECAKDDISNIKNDSSLSKTEKTSMIKETTEEYESATKILSQTESFCIYNYEVNSNAIIVGGSGAGKSRGITMPNLLQFHGSGIFTDLKGELFHKSAYAAQQSGKKVKVLNLLKPSLSMCYNCFKYINRKREGWEENVLQLIETIRENTDGGEKRNSNDPFWDRAEELFLQALFFLTLYAFPKEEQNMATVMTLGRMLEIPEDGADNRDSDLDILFELFAERFGRDNIAVLQYNEFRSKASGKTAKSVVISAVARLAPFNIPGIKKLTSYDDMELDRFGEEEIYLYLIVPPTTSTLNFIAGMLITQLFQELLYCALEVHKDTQRLPVHVHFGLDEIANTFKIPNLMKILSIIRSMNGSIDLFIQSIPQLEELFGRQWEVALDNCQSLVYLGNIRASSTLKYMSELIGFGTFHKKSSSKSISVNRSYSVSTDTLKRELLDPAEVAKIKKDTCIVHVMGFNPFYSKKYNLKKHPNYHLTSDYKKTNVIDPSRLLIDRTVKPIEKDLSNDKIAKISPHGEDFEIKVDSIAFNSNQTEILQMLKLNISKMWFDGSNIENTEVAINENDLSTIETMVAASASINARIEENDAILSSMIEFSANPHDLSEVVNEMSKSIENISFDAMESVTDEEIENDIPFENDEINAFLSNLEMLDVSSVI